MACSMQDTKSSRFRMFDWAEVSPVLLGSALNSWRAPTWEKVEAFVRLGKCTQAHTSLCWFISILSTVEASAIRELQRIGIPCVEFLLRQRAGIYETACGVRGRSLCIGCRSLRPCPCTARQDCRSCTPRCHVGFQRELRNSPGLETEPATFSARQMFCVEICLVARCRAARISS